MNTLPDHLKAWPELAQACIRSKETTLLRAWLCLRATSPDLCGILPLDTTIDLLTTSFGWSPQYARHILDKGNDAWWWLSTDKKGIEFVRLQSLGRLCERLDCPLGHPVYIHWDELTTGHQAFSSACYAAWIGQGRGEERTISRTTLSRLWGVTKQTQRNWERRGNSAGKTHVQHRCNIALLPKPTLETLQHYPDCDDPRIKTDPHGNLWMQLPNTYQADRRSAPQGQRERKLARRLRSASLLKRAWQTRDTGDPLKRRYFHTLTAARKSDARPWAYVLTDPKKGEWLAV